MTPKRKASFYVTAYHDHLNGVAPSTPVLTRKKRADGTPVLARPGFRVPHLLNGEVPVVEKMDLPVPLADATYWVCSWTEDDLAAMGCEIAYEADERFLNKWPDIWNLDGINVNARGRAALEAAAPDKCLFFKAVITKRGTDTLVEEDRWVVFVRHWLRLNGPEQPFPETDFETSIRAPLFRKIQYSAPLRSFCNTLGLFAASPIDSAKPTFSAETFTTLMSHGITGLKEKTSRSFVLHDPREVIGHVI